MNRLLEKLNCFRKVTEFSCVYSFENNDKICFKFKLTDFPHIIGLHKLIDIPIIRQFNDKENRKISAKFILSRIKKEDILTEATIMKSKYFLEIQNRYEAFTINNLMSIIYADKAIVFNPLTMGSYLHAEYILFEKKEMGYHHLCIAKDSNGVSYVESFFCEPTDIYLRKQELILINKVEIYDKDNKIYLLDQFNKKD